jgi:hypothetical protein
MNDYITARLSRRSYRFNHSGFLYLVTFCWLYGETESRSRSRSSLTASMEQKTRMRVRGHVAGGDDTVSYRVIFGGKAASPLLA